MNHKRQAVFKYHEKLDKYEICWLIFCFLVFFVWSAVFLSGKFGPDELERKKVSDFICNNLKLPYGNEEELRNPYWGFSYGLSFYLPYSVSALFQRIAGIFTDSKSASIIAARFTSVLSMTGVCYYSIQIGKKATKSPARWIFIVIMSFLPQAVFLGSYQNLDSFELLTVMMTIFCWINGLNQDWEPASCVALGIASGLCLMSYEFAYPYLVGSLLIYTVWFLQNRSRVKFGEFIKKGLLVLGVAFIVSGWVFIRNAVLYDGDIFGLKIREQYQELYGCPFCKPSANNTLRGTGVGIISMLFERKWILITALGYVCCLGYMEYLADIWVYIFYYLIFAIGTVGFFAFFCPKRKERQKKLMSVIWIAIASSVLTVMLSMYYSWDVDFQPQGRYIIATLPFIAGVTSIGLSEISNRLAVAVGLNVEKAQKRVCLVFSLLAVCAVISAFFACISAGYNMQ